jgi:Transglycosylase SLT domain
MPNLPVQLRKGWQAVVGAAQGILAGFGLLALLLVAIEGGRVLPFGAATTAAFAGTPEPAPPLDVAVAETRNPQHKALAGYLARRYRVAGDATVDLVGEAYAVGQAVGLDPLLILAVISVESRFNPIAESDMGAKGLMQVIPRFHTEKLAVHGGQNAVLDPKTNILVGAQILKEYIRLAGGLEAGLQMYNGSADDPSQGYAQKVIVEKQRLEQALRTTRTAGASA